MRYSAMFVTGPHAGEMRADTRPFMAFAQTTLMPYLEFDGAGLRTVTHSYVYFAIGPDDGLWIPVMWTRKQLAHFLYDLVKARADDEKAGKFR